MPGAFENGMPLRSICDSCSSVSASCRSPHGLSSGNPSACDSRWRIVMRGESVVGYASAVSSGTYRLGRIVERQLALVAQLQDRHRGEALGHRRDAEHRVGVDRRLRRDVADPAAPGVRELAVDDDAPRAPGTCDCSVKAVKRRSMSANAASRRVRRCASANAGGGALKSPLGVCAATGAIERAASTEAARQLMVRFIRGILLRGFRLQASGFRLQASGFRLQKGRVRTRLAAMPDPVRRGRQ